MTEIYCAKCKQKQRIDNEIRESKDGKRGTRYYVKGVCSVCGNRCATIIKTPGAGL